MSEWQIDVAPTARETYEAMVLGGQSTLRGTKRAAITAHAIFTGLFAPLGITMVLWVLVQMLGGPALGELPVAALPLTLLAFAALGIWLMRQVNFVVAQATVASRFGRWQQITLDANGISIRTAHSSWQSGWGDVVAVRAGKTCICVAVSGVVFTLPLRAFANAPDANHALKMMREWHSEAAG